MLHDGPAVLPIYSLTKSFIAASIIAARVNLESPVAHWLGSHWVPRGREISVAQLLNHTSGLRDYGGTPEYAVAIESGRSPWSDEEFAELTLRQPLLFEPGTGWSYSNPGYWLLGQILQRKVDAELGDAIQTLVGNPLGLSSLRLARGQFAASLPDYPAEWVWHGTLLASANDVARFMASPVVQPLRTHLQSVGGAHSPWRDPHYGLGLMLEPGERYGHNGEGPRFSASAFYFEKSRLSACVLLRSDEPDRAMSRLLNLSAAHQGGE